MVKATEERIGCFFQQQSAWPGGGVAKVAKVAIWLCFHGAMRLTLFCSTPERFCLTPEHDLLTPKHLFLSLV